MGLDIGNSLVLEQVADRAIGLARARDPRGLQHAVGAKGAQRERSALEHRRQLVAIARARDARPDIDGIGAAVGDGKSVEKGKGGSVRVAFGARRTFKKKKKI